MHRYLLTVPAAAALILAPALVRAQDFTWHGAIAQGQSIEIKGVNGDVRAQKTVIGLADLAGVLVVGVNAGSIDRSHPYDPDDDHAPSGFTVTLAK